MAAEKSEPPRPSVVGTPSRVAAINPPMTGTPFLARIELTAAWAFLRVLFHLGSRMSVGCVGDDAFARIHPNTVDCATLKGGGHYLARNQLAEGKQKVAASWRKFAHSRHAVEEIFQLVEAVIDFRCDLGNVVFQQLSCGLEMPLTQGLQQGSERICIAARGLLTHEYKLIGDLSQSTNHHNSPMPPTALHDRDYAADGLRILDRGASKFHHH